MAEGEKPVDEKLAHQTVRYERPSTYPGERCNNCSMAIKQVPMRCTIVASPIWPNGWCRRYEKK